MLQPVWKILKLSELEPVVLPVFTAETMKKFVRGESGLSEVTEGSNIFPEVLEGKYKMNLSDIWIGLQKIKKASYEEQYAWIIMLRRFPEETESPHTYLR